MEPSEEMEQSANQPMDVTPAQTGTSSPASRLGTTSSYVYALGRVVKYG